MKKYLLLVILASCCQILIGQVTKPTTVKPSTVVFTPIPSTKAITIRKETRNLQVQLNRLNDSTTNVKKEMDALVTSMKSDLNSMSEMGEMESLRLQMAMDRLSKLMSTLSNLLKKASDTQQSITQNLK